MPSRLRKWREAASSMHPAGWLWAFMHKSPTPKRFDLLYKLGKGDPWRTENAPYEDRKRADLISLLRDQYTRILDAGCGTGTLTRMLAAHGPVLGIDASQVAVQRARNAGGEDVTYHAADLTQADLSGPYGLVVASEVLYYLLPDQRESVIARLAKSLESGGHFVVAGGKGDDRVIPILENQADLKAVIEIVRDDDVWRPYRIALFEKV